MKERPIIFNSEMVRAILEGRKTQTRRVIKPQPEMKLDGVYQRRKDKTWSQYSLQAFKEKCPYGKVGDRLWVRESFKDWGTGTKRISYKSDYTKEEEEIEFEAGGVTPKWKPSIHMPRWASRITLKITNIRVERLQEITEADARAEGVSGVYPVDHFANLWHSIYKKKYTWKDNPWVWVIEFEKIKPGV